MTNIEQLYYLLKAYKNKEYDINTFCDELTLILYYETSAINELKGNERQCFEDLGEIALRYSPYEEDRKAYPKAYTSDEDVAEAIDIACFKLGIK